MIPSITNSPPHSVTIGKIPGALHTIPITDKQKICALFITIGMKDLKNCEIQKNGISSDLNEYAQAGDTILAITKIRGN